MQPIVIMALISLLLLLSNPAGSKARGEEPPPQQDGAHQLTDRNEQSTEARILYVGSKDVYIRIRDGRTFQVPLANLNTASKSLVDEWKKRFRQPLTGSQREYLKSAEPVKLIESKDVRHDSGKPFLNDPAIAKSLILDRNFSDEFNTSNVDRKKWIDDMHPWGDRAWSQNNITQKGGSLEIRATYEPHTNKGEKYFYKLGILQSRQKITYGFFEARIKGCSRFPGLCPAFWVYSDDRSRNATYPKVTYCEIDIVEMQQNLYEPSLQAKAEVTRIDCNLHCRILDDSGKEIWQRPNSLPEVCAHHFDAPWDPRDDFHIYACENTPEKITWYIDGEKIAEEENLYWHLPMNIALTMELRPPFIDWAGVDGRVPVADEATAEGFPTVMAVDYVRVWRIK